MPGCVGEDPRVPDFLDVRSQVRPDFVKQIARSRDRPGVDQAVISWKYRKRLGRTRLRMAIIVGMFVLRELNGKS